MPEKKTNKVAANNKKAETKKTETVKSKATQVEKKVEKEVKADVKKVEEFAAKTDKEVDNLVKKVWFVDKIINASWMKEILNLSFMESANKRVRKHLETICKIFGWIGLVGWAIFAIYAVVMFIIWIVALFHGWVWAFLLSILMLALAALTLIMSRGLLKMKKWYPAAAIILLALDIVILVISMFAPSMSFGSQLFSFIISIIFLLFVLKNKDMFKN